MVVEKQGARAKQAPSGRASGREACMHARYSDCRRLADMPRLHGSSAVETESTSKRSGDESEVHGCVRVGWSWYGNKIQAQRSAGMLRRVQSGGHVCHIPMALLPLFALPLVPSPPSPSETPWRNTIDAHSSSHSRFRDTGSLTRLASSALTGTRKGKRAKAEGTRCGPAGAESMTCAYTLQVDMLSSIGSRKVAMISSTSALDDSGAFSR